MPLATRFTELVGCQVPIQQAPMGSVLGQVEVPVLAAADAAAGSTEITGAFPVCPLCATVPRARVLRSCIHALGAEVDLHLRAPQGGEVPAHVGLADVAPGHQEPDHERGVEDLSEPEGLRDVQRHPSPEIDRAESRPWCHPAWSAPWL
jgi:hypothetical protein